jgi:hypothetical protein
MEPKTIHLPIIGKMTLKDFWKLLSKIMIILLILGFIAFFLFTVEFHYDKKNGLSCGVKPIDVDIKINKEIKK